MSSTRQKGFTLVELLAVLTVTGILLAVMVSAYRTFTVRREVAAALRALAPIKDAIELASRRYGWEPPADAHSAGASPDSSQPRALARVTVMNGRIDAMFGDQADAALSNRMISLTPFETASHDVVWICGSRTPGPGLEPLGFAAGGRRAVQIPPTVEARYLPAECR